VGILAWGCLIFLLPNICLPLAQEGTFGALFWCAVLFVFLLAAGVIVMWVRKALSPNEDFHGEGFSLGDLRRLHKAGQLTDEEFDRAKSLIVAGMQKAAQKQAPALPQKHDFKPDAPSDQA
jgi:hypothetical protein